MDPKTAIDTLRDRGWTDQRIADAVGVTQPTIWRTRSAKAVVNYGLGSKLIELAKRESRKRAKAA